MRSGDIEIDLKYCNGCTRCYVTCPQDVFGWNKDEGMPLIKYPDECWYCGVCRTECSEEAITVHTPFQQKFFWRIFKNINKKA